jgi:hypothetical protein
MDRHGARGDSPTPGDQPEHSPLAARALHRGPGLALRRTHFGQASLECGGDALRDAPRFAPYLRDVRDKTLRGLEGRALDGYATGVPRALEIGGSAFGARHGR